MAIQIKKLLSVREGKLLKAVVPICVMKCVLQILRSQFRNCGGYTIYGANT